MTKLATVGLRNLPKAKSKYLNRDLRGFKRLIGMIHFPQRRSAAAPLRSPREKFISRQGAKKE